MNRTHFLHRTFSRLRNPFFWPILVTACCLAGVALAAASGPMSNLQAESSLPSAPDTPAWQEVNRLVDAQQLARADSLVMELLDEAKAMGDSKGWLHGLVRSTQLKLALHGWETAVMFLKSQPWPQDLLSRSVLNLFYAHSLTRYARGYRWEIVSREKIAAPGAIDLKKWTLDQIFSQAQTAFYAVWQDREQLGNTPAGSLSEYLEPNTYPDGVRPSLRDAVSYLYTALLADSVFWNPRDAHAIYRLNLDSLLAETPAPSPSLIDPAAHPLLKIGWILGDLETWHRTSGRKTAGLEARMERLRLFHPHFTRNKDRRRLREDLRTALESARNTSWWAAGMALLAEFTRSEETADNLVQARKTAQAGLQAFPESLGAKRCQAIVDQIEAPNFRIEAMVSDGPARPSIGVFFKNLPALHLRAYSVDLFEQIASTTRFGRVPDRQQIQSLLESAEPDFQWTVDLAATADFKEHRQDVIPPMDNPGLYVVTASATADYSPSNNKILAVHLVIGDLVLLSRPVANGVETTVLSGATGRPVPGVDVRLYADNRRKGHPLIASDITAGDGTVTFQTKHLRGYFLAAQKQGDVAVQYRGIDRPYLGATQESTATLIYTDRSLYRPRQTIYWKAVVYRGNRGKGAYETLSDTPLTVSLVTPNNQETATRTVATNRFGTASGQFIIPDGSLLGAWKIKSSLNGQAQVRIEAYKRPTFEVRLLDPQSVLRLNRPARLKGECRYYFGLPVTQGQVKWWVERSPMRPWGWLDRGWMPPPFGRSQTVAAGASALGPDGSFELTFVPEAEERLDREISYRYTLTAEVIDEGGETRSSVRSFQIGPTAIQATVAATHEFNFANRPFEVSIQRTDLNGSPAPGTGRWRVAVLKGPKRTLLPADQPLAPQSASPASDRYALADDLKRPRWNPRYRPEEALAGWVDGDIVASGKTIHDEEGHSTVRLPPLPAGIYRLRYQTVDPFGQPYQTFRILTLSGKGLAPPLPALLEVEQTTVAVGQTARILVCSGLVDQLITLDIYQGGRRIDQKRLEPGADQEVIDLPVTEDLRGGFGVTLTALRDHQLIQLSRTVFVPWDNKELHISFATFRDRLRPGGREKWTVSISGPGDGDVMAGAAEVLAYMVDRSLDAIWHQDPPDPLTLYPNRSRPVLAIASLGQANAISTASRGFNPVPSPPAPQPDRLVLLDAYGIGGPGRRHRMLPRTMAASPEENGLTLTVAEAGKQAGVPPSADTPPEPPAAEEPSAVLRSDFAETAFFKPHLLTGPDGTVSFEFTVPDAVTGWNVWIHGITRDLKAGFLKQEAHSVKDLMVRPYLPRFLREGDTAEIQVVVNNASDKAMHGHVKLDILDPDTGRSLAEDFGLAAAGAIGRPFRSPPGGSAKLTFFLRTPARLGQADVKVMAEAGNLKDGELRPLPILPGRMHLAQSRFAVLKDAARREMTFGDLLRDDPTRINEQMVITIDGQLFYGVLAALPYLVDYPYACTEQILNRFVSTGILSTLYENYPDVADMARKLSRRSSRLETWDDLDPNRKMALEETPWLQQARGGEQNPDKLTNVLDPAMATARRDASLEELKKAQTPGGGFPWFPGGPPSAYMTLYQLYGLSKGMEFGVESPRQMIQAAWGYLHSDYLGRTMKEMADGGCCWEFVTFLNYVLSNYPHDDPTGGVFTSADREAMADFSFRNWKAHSPYLKCYLALTLHRMGRGADARLVWNSVMDSAKTTEDQGTFWAPEARGWLWYNDTVESQAFALRALMELAPEDPRADSLVLWLFLNKKLNHWKSTRATAEAIYSLAHYMKRTGSVARKEAAVVEVGNRRTAFVFTPDAYTGKKNRVVIPGDQVGPATATVVVEKSTPGYLLASATWHFSTETLPREARGDTLSLRRSFFRRAMTPEAAVLHPLGAGAAVAPGDEVEVHLTLTTAHPMEYVHLRDPRAAGFEPAGALSGHRWQSGIYRYQEIRDSGTHFFFEHLPQGEYTIKYRIRAATAGTYAAAPATVQPMYAPEFAAHSAGQTLKVTPGL